MTRALPRERQPGHHSGASLCTPSSRPERDSTGKTGISGVATVHSLVQKSRWWDEPRWRCLAMDLRGVPRRLIASTLNVHRNTITLWTNREEYQREFTRRLLDQTMSGAFRRRYQTAKALFEVSEIAERAFAVFDKQQSRKHPNFERCEALLTQAISLNKEFRGLCDQHRRDEQKALDTLMRLAERLYRDEVHQNTQLPHPRS